MKEKTLNDYIKETGIKPFSQMAEEEVIDAVENGHVFQFLTNTLDSKWRILQYLTNPSKKVQKLAVQQNPWAIEYIHDPSEEVQKLAVQQNVWAIEYMHDPSEEVQKLAVQQDPDVFSLIRNPSKELCIFAVEKNVDNLKFVPAKYFEVEEIIGDL